MTGFLSRRNPTVKLALLFVVSLGTLWIFDPVTPMVLYLLALFGVCLGARPRPRSLVLAHIPLVSFALGVFLVNALSRPGTPAVEGSPIRVTIEGLALGGAFAWRALLIGVLSFGFIVSTDAVALLTSLHQHARLNDRLSYALMAGYRMLQQLPGDWQVIRQAQSVRAPFRRNGRPRAGLPAYATAAFTLLVVAIRRGEQVARSLEARGLGAGPRSLWRPVALGWTDAAFAGLVLAAGSSVIVAGAIFGFTRSSAVLFGS